MPNPTRISLPRVNYNFGAKACVPVLTVMLNKVEKDYSTVINTTAVALGVLGALLAIVIGLSVAGHVRKKRRRAAQRAAVAAAVTLDADAAAGNGGNGWTVGASGPAAPFVSSASDPSASPDSDADSSGYRGRHLR